MGRPGRRAAATWWPAAVLAVAPALQWQSFSVLVPGDLLIMPLVAIGLLRRVGGDAAQNRLRHRLMLPAVVITVGSLLALINVGVTSWAINTLVLDAVVALMFLGVLAYVRQRGLDPRLMAHAVVAAGVFVSLVAFAQRGYRPSATFSQSNMTGHFLASCFVFTVVKCSNRVRITAGPIIVAATALTSSFGALVSIAAVIAWFAYGSMRRRLRNTSPALVALLWLALLGGLGLALKGPVLNRLASADSAEGLSGKRLDKSESGRKDIWLDGWEALQADPLGLGPGGFKALGIHQKVVNGTVDTSEIHHDFIGYTVERGYIGLAGLVLLYGVLWFAGRRRGLLRGLLVMTIVGGLFRETLHFRHLWIYLAIAAAIELRTPDAAATAVRGRRVSSRSLQAAAAVRSARSVRPSRASRARMYVDGRARVAASQHHASGAKARPRHR